MEILLIKGSFTCPICGHEQSRSHIEQEIYKIGISIDNEFDNFEDFIRCPHCTCNYVAKGDCYLSIDNFNPVKLSNKEKLIALRRRLMFYIYARHSSPKYSRHIKLTIERLIALARDIQEEIKNGASLNA